MRRLLTGLACLLAACSGEVRTVSDEGAPDPVIDEFELSISVGRWGVMIDNARSALRLMDPAGDLYNPTDNNAHYALKYGAIELLNLRNEVCYLKLVPEETCQSFELPQWVYVYEPTPPPASELARRSEWLGAALGPFEEAACKKVREEDPFANMCMVE